MNNIEYAWVIQRDDGLFWCGFDGFVGLNVFSDRIIDGLNTQTPTYKHIREEIRDFQLQNCKPVKVKIEVVEDE